MKKISFKKKLFYFFAILIFILTIINHFFQDVSLNFNPVFVSEGYWFVKNLELLVLLFFSFGVFFGYMFGYFLQDKEG